ncbi:MAG: hypothetical protein ACRDT6_16040 [Micromonosporaceae bacterium]
MEGQPPRADLRPWNRNQASAKPWPKSDFKGWLNATIRLEGNRNRGGAFQRQVVRHYKLGGPNWICEGSLKKLDPKLHRELKKELGDKFPRSDRRFDAVNTRDKIIYEMKSGCSLDPAEINVDKALARRGWRVVYLCGEEPDKATRRKLAETDSRGRGRIDAYRHKATPNPRYQTTPYTRNPGIMNPDPNRAGNGAALRMVNGSPQSPEQARRIATAERGGLYGSQRMRGPGGVDFSTLELRYVGMPANGRGLDYSFKAGINPDPDNNPSSGGLEKAQLASDSFFTWLALTPEKFWVNLNPDQPDKIMDDKFGKTDAGRVLLEADLEMKHDFADAMNPKTRRGALFWDSLARRNGAPCLHSMRNWIEPRPAKVREQDGGIYILDAPLKLSSVPQKFKTPPGSGGKQCDLTEVEIQHNQRMVNRMIVPEVERRINEKPTYGDLRRVYTSRVAAEWVKQKNPSEFSRIIGGNDVSRWPIRGQKWDRHDTYQRYLKSYKEGDYSFEREYGGRVYVYTVGGVDFQKSPKRNVTKAQFDVENPKLPIVTDRSKIAPRDYRDTGRQYLGANTQSVPSAPSNPGPSPSPTTTKPPSTPPSEKPGAGPTKPGGGGGLPNTGLGVPLGWLAGLAAGLIAVGAGLVWWMRRRRPSEG